MPILNLKVEDTQKVIVKPDQITVTYTATTYNFIGSGATSVVVDDRDVTIYTNPSGVNIVGSGSTDVSIINNEWVIHTPEVDVPTLTSELTNDSGFITISDIPVIPTNVSEFNNDAGYITISDIPEEKTLVGSGDTVVTLSGDTYVVYTPTGDTGGGTWGNITGTLANQTDLQQALNAKANQVDFTEHTGDTSIHYPMSGISINVNQISNFPTFTGSGSTQVLVGDNEFIIYSTPPTGTTVTWDDVLNKPNLTLYNDFTGHTSDSTIHFPFSAVTEAISASTSGLTSSWNEITDKPSWLSGTTLEAFQSGHTHSYNTLTDKPDLNSYVLQSDFTTHTGDTSIHYPMSGITITRSQVSDFITIQGSGDTTVTLSGDTYVVYTPTGETGSESLSGLTDVTLTSPQNLDTLIYSGGTWINKESIDIESNVSDGDLLQRSGNTIVGYTPKTITGSGDTTVTLSGDTYIVHSESFSGSYTDLTDKPTLGSIASYDVWTGTQAQYDALGSYSSTTIYLIEEA